MITLMTMMMTMMRRRRRLSWPVLALTCLLLPPAARADYLVRPFAMLGIDGGSHAFQLTPEGWVRSGTATLAVSLDGEPIAAWNWDAAGPGVARAGVQGAGGELSLEAAAVRRPGLTFAARFRGSAANRDTVACRLEQPVAILRLRLEPASGAAPPRLGVRLMADSGQEQAVILHDGIVPRQVTPPRPAAVWAAGGRAGVVVADSLVLLTSLPPDSTAFGMDLAGQPAPATLDLVYRPTGPLELELRMPFLPVVVADGGEALAALMAGHGAELIAGSSRDWQERLALGARLSLPELPAAETVQASLYHILGGSLVAAGDRAVILGAPFLYREFYMRDAAYMVVALDQFGFHNEARICLERMLTHQAADGELMSHLEQHDGIGLALWALGEHVAYTRDRAFAAEVMGRVGRAMNWYRAALAPYQGPVPGERGEWDRDHPGILPATIMQDNEQVVAAHIVGHNLWASSGLAGAITVAEAAGAADSVRSWQKLSATFHRSLERSLETLQKRAGGLILPSFEGAGAQAGYDQPASTLGGLDWGNLEIVYPTRVWRADDPRLRPSLDAWSERLTEGLYPYPLGFNPNLVHHYLSTSLAHALLRAGGDRDREHLFTIFYDGLLGHVTSTFGGSELINTRVRDVWPLENIPPHNTFSSRYLLLVRDMIASEIGDTLLAGAGLSPAWLTAGNQIALEGTATRFGWVDVGIGVRAPADSVVALTLRVAIAGAPPARYLSPRTHLPLPQTPIDLGEAPAPLGAVVFPAPLGYRVSRVHDTAGATVGVIQRGGRRVVLTPASAASGVEVELQGASDPALSAGAARTRLGL